MRSKNNKKKENPIDDKNFLKRLLSENKEYYHRNEIIGELEAFYGEVLANLISKEWDLIEISELIKKFEIEHGNSLALLIENESQRIKLEELNNKLNNAALIREKDMKMAENVQKSLLYNFPPHTKDYEISFHYEPLASVSGDFYDFYIKNDYLKGLVLADISGHGIASSLLTMLTKPIFFRTFNDEEHANLGHICEKINEKLIQQIEASDHYLTAVMLRFDKNSVEYVNAAHPDILIKDHRENKCSVVLPPKTMQGSIMGISAINTAFESYTFPLRKGDYLIIHSDCLVESQNANKQEFGREKLINTIESVNDSISPHEMLTAILTSLHNHMSDMPLKDDLTIIILKKVV